MKKIFLMCLLISSLFSKDRVLTENEIRTLKEERTFYTICVDNYKWVQFVSCRGLECRNIGNPIQMFYDAKVESALASRMAVPMVCKEK